VSAIQYWGWQGTNTHTNANYFYSYNPLAGGVEHSIILSSTYTLLFAFLNGIALIAYCSKLTGYEIVGVSYWLLPARRQPARESKIGIVPQDLNAARRRQIFWIVYSVAFMIEFSIAVIYVMVVSLWVMLGLLIDPTKVAPFAMGIMGVYTHLITMRSKLKSFYESIVNGVKQQIADFKTEAERDTTNKIYGIEDVQLAEFKDILEKFGCSTRTLMVILATSTVAIIAILVFLFIGMNAFEGPTGVKSIISSFMAVGAAIGVNVGKSPAKGAGKLKRLIDRIFLEWKKQQGAGDFGFSLDEKLTDMLDRAETHFN